MEEDGQVRCIYRSNHTALPPFTPTFSTSPDLNIYIHVSPQDDAIDSLVAFASLAAQNESLPLDPHQRGKRDPVP